MNKLIFCLALAVISSLSFGQETRSINQDYLTSSELKLSNDWMITIANQQAIIKNGRITNKSSKSSRRIDLELFLSASPIELSSGKITGYSMSEFDLKSIKGNSSMAGVNIQFENKEMP